MFCNHAFSPRYWFVGVVALLLAIFSLLLLSDQHSAAQVPLVGTKASSNSANIKSTLIVEVNYGQDWVAGVTDLNDPGITVAVSLTDIQGALKADAEVTAETTGDFFIGCDDWFSGECPDIVPGDHLTVSTETEIGEINPIGSIFVDNLNASEDTVSGILDVGEFVGMQLDVSCEIWEEMGPVINTKAQADNGRFTCDFAALWDLQIGDLVAIRYYQPDLNSVINIAVWPWMWVNLGFDQVGGNYHAGQNLEITVSDSIDTIKASATVTSDWSGGPESEGFATEDWNWLPKKPDIQPFDQVHIEASNGYTNTIQPGSIDAVVEAENDAVNGTIIAPTSFQDPLVVECHPWGAWNNGINDAPIKQSWAEPDGSVPFSCQWDPETEWDIQPGQEIAVMYIEPDGDHVIDVFEEPAPYLRVQMQGFGGLTQGGNANYLITLWNEGTAPAENVVLSDVMDGLEYLEDTSGYIHTGEGSDPIIWQVGTLEPNQRVQFDFFAQVIDSVTVTNTISVTTSTESDQGYPWEKTSTLVNTVNPNDTYLNIGKRALTTNPAADQFIIFELDVCNEGSTGSSTVTLTDQLSQDLSLDSWWSYEAGWTGQLSGSGQLELNRPTISAGTCGTIYMRAHVASSANIGDQIYNSARIDAANNLSVGENEAFWVGQVGLSQINVRIDKTWVSGQLVPGGLIHYNLHYENTGNIPVGSFVITDNFPINATYVGAWIKNPWGSDPIQPDYLDDNSAEWQISELENGVSGDIEVVLEIDAGVETGTELINTAEINLLQEEEIRYDDNVSELREIIFPLLPNLRIHKSHEWVKDWQLIYLIQFQNIGSEVVNDIQIIDTMPPDTEWSSWQSFEFDPERLTYWYYDGELFHWKLNKLLPGETGLILFRVNLTKPTTPLHSYTNSVEITIPDGDPSPEDNFAETIAFSSEGYWHIYLPLVNKDN